MYAEQIGSGSLVNGKRVGAMTRGMVDGRRVVTVQFEETFTKRGKLRKRLSAPVTYTLGTVVPGTPKPTTWAMPAGPVGRKPGAQLSGGWWGDGDDNSRDARTDRHSRMIDSLVYA